MKNFKSIVCLVLAVAMILSFTACGNRAKDKTSKVEGFHKTGYPIVDEPITIKVMGPTNTSRAVSWKDNEAFKHLEEITNVKFEFMEVDSSSFSEKLSLTLAGGDLPDIIIGANLSRDAISQQFKQGNFIDLRPYIEQYAENANKYINEYDEIKNSITLPSGEIPSLPYLDMNIDGGKCPSEMLMIYQPWLDKLGLKMPENTDELYKVLKAFKEKDPNGNGIADEIPLCPRNTNMIYPLFSMFGVIVDTSSYLFLDNNEIKYAPLMPEFKEALEYIHKLYAEGLLDKDAFIQTEQQVLAKGTSDVPVIGSTVSSAAFVVVGEERNTEMIATPVIESPSGKRVWKSREFAAPGRFVVTKACKYPEVAVRLIDYMFSDDGAKLFWMGTEGETYKADEDGSWDWIYSDGETTEQVRARGTIQTSVAMAGALPKDWFKLKSGSEAVINKQRVEMVEKYGEALRIACPKFYYDSTVQKEVSAITADLNAYVKQSVAKFVTGEMSIEKDWSEFETTLKNMRMEELLQYAQDAYKKYNAEK